MSVTQYPSPDALQVVSDTVASANTAYTTPANLKPGIYRVTCISTTVANVAFYGTDNAHLVTATTSSGTVDVVVGAAVAKLVYWINTGSNVVVNIERLAIKLPTGTASGTLETITTSQTYSGSGYGIVLAVGGGGGGGGGWSANPGSAGGGGGSGGLRVGGTTLSGMVITIGAGGNAGARGTPATAGGAGGATTAGNQTANGGGGGSPGGGGYNVAGAGGAGGTPSGVAGGTGNNLVGNGGVTLAASVAPIRNDTTGGGAGGNIAGWVAQGSGIGTGGIPNGTNANGNAATGYGAGGGAGLGNVTTAGNAGAGSPGVVYILKFS
jgi:hypothetical protein